MDPPPTGTPDEFAPDPPAGYGRPWRCAYPALAVNVAAAVLSLAAVAGFGRLAPSLRRAEFVEWVVLVDTPDEPVLDFTGVGVVVGFPVTVALRTPPKTLSYDVDVRHSYVFEPADGGVTDDPVGS